MFKFPSSTGIISFLFLYLSGTIVETKKWTYRSDDEKGPSRWSVEHQVCGNDNQSPVDISTGSVVPDHGLRSLKFYGFDQSLSSTMYENNGHTITLNFGTNDVYVTDELGQEYKALQLHFHWRKDEKSSGGSEHTIDGKHYPVEVHIVHIKKGYKSLEEVKYVRDGLLVLGVFLEIDPNLLYENDPYAKLFEAAPKHMNDKISNKVDVRLADLLPTSKSFYRYFGSLTTPPCYESVKWTVLQNAFKISKKSLEELESSVFQEEMNKKNNGSYTRLGGNFRPVMPLNGRQITEFKAFEEDTSNYDWGYTGNKGPSKWHEILSLKNNSCNAKKQSPINIVTVSTTVKIFTNKTIQFSKSYSEFTNGELANNGHSIAYHLNKTSDLTYRQDEKFYKAIQLHFHWASVMFSTYNQKFSTKGGSEHTIDSVHYPIEMHIVHKNKDKNSKHKPDGYAVLGVFLKPAEDNEVDKQANEAISKLTTQFEISKFKNTKAIIKHGPILLNLLPKNQSFYRYYGSLTTPDCSEFVMWTVYKQVLKISKNNFFKFQQLLSFSKDTSKTSKSIKSSNKEAYISGNYRPVQDLNGREIDFYTEIPNEEVDAGSFVFFGTVIAVALAIIVCGIVVYKRALSKSPSSNYTKGKQEEQSPETEMTNLES